MPCVKGLARRVGDRPFSGCKHDCLHRRLVEDFRHERQAQEARADAWSAGYATERRAFFRHGDSPNLSGSEDSLTFKGWLMGHARPDFGGDA